MGRITIKFDSPLDSYMKIDMIEIEIDGKI